MPGNALARRSRFRYKLRFFSNLFVDRRDSATVFRSFVGDIPMRSTGVIAAMLCALEVIVGQSTRARAAEQFPYTAYVNSEDVYIRSGPGKNYYPTEKLAKGQPVEIYRHDPGGWYAIRPPEGSFSWVQADCLKPQGERLAVVEKDRAMCYVGTRFSSARDVHQVRLDKGEQVEILDVKQIGEGADAQSWCQIAPPSGEFRWVFGKFVDREPPTGLSGKGSGFGVQGSDKNSKAPPSDREAFNDSALRTDWTAKGAQGSAPSGQGSAAAGWRSTAGGRSADEKAPVASSDPFQADLNALDFDVSKMVADDPGTWEFTALRRRADALLPRADTAIERGKVRLILNRIARFEDVKRRNELLAQNNTAIAVTTNRTTSLPADSAPQFDGVGKLTPVVSQRPNAPQYALVDRSNQVVTFITPAPGVNLQPYVGQEVGVSGQRGFMPELRKPHVTAMRVSVVDEGPLLR